MPWKPGLLFCIALTLSCVALISHRVCSVGLINVAETSTPLIEAPFDEDLDVSLEEEPSPLLQRHAHPSQSGDSPLKAISDAETGKNGDIPIQSTPPSTSHPPCFPDEVLLVSTMDGKITALDLEHLEKPIWSVGTGSSPSTTPEPLLATSNVKIEAGASWVIPSLDGMLHKFDLTSDERGDHLKSTATSSEEILERSIRLDDEDLASSARTGLTVYGSKEVTVIGINARNGHICYFCDGSSGENGCSADRAAIDDCGLTDEDDVIVVRRVSHSVKALKTRTGEQRWNYSVAQNHLRLEEGPGIRMESHFPPPKRSSTNDVVITTCDQPSTAGIKGLRFDVLKGRVLIDAASDGRLYDFNVPIANVWLVSKGKLNPINLFDAENIALPSSGPSNFLTFVGSFNNQYYVQHSNKFHDLVSLRNGRQTSNRELEWHSGPRDPGVGSSKRPALTYDKMTPAVGHTRLVQETAVATWKPRINPGDYLRPVNEYQLEVELSKLSGASRWWRQLLKIRNLFMTSPYISMGVSVALSSCLVLIVTFIVQCKQWREMAITREKSPSLSKMPSISDSGFEKSMKGFLRSDSRSIGECRSMPIMSKYDSSPQRSPPPVGTLPDIPEPNSVKPIYVTSPSNIEFDSRFYQDFEPMKCLGKGGFGVVFEAKNRLDDCAYAIKRITLKNKPESKERVRREVMALAKLDHIGIVRYYHAWFESPPVGWDDPFLSHLTSLSTDMFSPTSSDLEQVLCTNASIKGDGGGEGVGGVNDSLPGKSLEDGSGDAQPKQRKRRQRYVSQATKDLIFNNNHAEHSLDVSLSLANDSDGNEDNDEEQSGLFPPPVPAVDSSDGISFRDDLEFSAIKSANSKFFHRADSHLLSSPNGSTLRRSDTLSPSDSGLELLPCRKSDNLNLSEESFDVVFEQDTQNASKGKFNAFLPANDDDAEEVDKDELGGPMGFFPVVAAEMDLKKEKETTPESRPSIGEKRSPSQKIFLYIQMQLCLKETLKDWLRVNLDRRHAIVLDVFAQIVDAVHFLHNQGLIHRDLKPSNIFFSASDGTVKIGDFGLVTAMVLDEPGPDDANNLTIPLRTPAKATTTTQQHTDQVGTKLYMSPEQSSGESYNEKVDIYALGVIFFELLHPFQTEMERGHTLTALRQEGLIPDDLRRAKKKESGLLLQMIHQDPNKRPSAEEIKIAVEDLENLTQSEDDRVGEDNLLRGRRRLRSSYSRGSSNSNKSGGSGKSPFGKEMNPESDVEDLAEDFDVIDDDNFLIEFADSSQEP